MSLPLLISKQEGQHILPYDYKLGWLFSRRQRSILDEFGAVVKNKECALSAAKRCSEKTRQA